MDVWRKTCLEAFDGDESSSAFILHLEQQGRIEGSVFIVHHVTAPKHQSLCEALGFTPCPDSSHSYQLPRDAWAVFLDAKRNIRSEWHRQQQQRLSDALTAALRTPPDPMATSHYGRGRRRLAVAAFTRQFKHSMAAIPFFQGLVGFLHFQLFKDRLAEWHLDPSVLTHTGSIQDYVHLLRDVLGFQLVSSSSENDDIIIWRMADNLSDADLSDILRLLPKHHHYDTYSYHLSLVHRSSHHLFMLLCHPYLFYLWIRHLLRRFFICK